MSIIAQRWWDACRNGEDLLRVALLAIEPEDHLHRRVVMAQCAWARTSWAGSVPHPTVLLAVERAEQWAAGEESQANVRRAAEAAAALADGLRRRSSVEEAVARAAAWAAWSVLGTRADAASLAAGVSGWVIEATVAQGPIAKYEQRTRQSREEFAEVVRAHVSLDDLNKALARRS